MNKKIVRVMVSGHTMSGKSTVARALQRALEAQGINVDTEGCEVHADQQGWMSRMSDRMHSLSQKGVRVIIEERMAAGNEDLDVTGPYCLRSANQKVASDE